MLKVVLTLIVFNFSGDPTVRQGEVPDLKICMEMATEFMSRKPDEFKAKGLGAGCTAILQSADPA